MMREDQIEHELNYLAEHLRLLTSKEKIAEEDRIRLHSVGCLLRAAERILRRDSWTTIENQIKYYQNWRDHLEAMAGAGVESAQAVERVRVAQEREEEE